MEKAEAIEMLRRGKEGVEEWNRLHAAGNTCDNLSNEDLAGFQLSDVDLSKVDLTHANLSQAILERANLTGATLEKATLQKTNLSSAKLGEANLTTASIAEANLKETDLKGANLSHTNFQDAILHKAILSDSDLTSAQLSTADLTDAQLQRANLTKAHLNQAILANAQLQGANLTEANLQECCATEARFERVVARRARFDRADLSGAVLDKSDIRGAEFNSANLSRASLRDVNANSRTTFAQMESVEKCVIDRHVLDDLGYELGKLTRGDLRSMKIVDDLATLRSYFTGIWLWLHVWSVLLFFFPYVWFLAQQWLSARFHSPVDPAKSMTILEALARFIWHGGKNWRTGGWWPSWNFVNFLVYAWYNAIRITLMLKTKKLETQQEVTGLPVLFSLESDKVARRCLAQMKWLVWAALAAVLFNAIHFLQMRVPR